MKPLYLGVCLAKEKLECIVLCVNPDYYKCIELTDERSMNKPQKVFDIMSKEGMEEFVAWFILNGISRKEAINSLRELVNTISKREPT